MGHFVYDEVDRIKFGEDWVDIKQRMSYGDQQKLVASYMQLQTQMKEALEVNVNLETGSITLLQINIKAWSFLGSDNRTIAPIDETTIRQLDVATANRLLEEVNKRNPPPKA